MRGTTLFFGATVALGGALVAVAGALTRDASLHAVALAAAAVVATELLQVSGDEHSLDPLDAQPFSFASPVHLASVVLLGIWPAVLLAALGLAVVDGLRGAPRRAVAFNASAFAIATAAGGAAFSLAGGTVRAIALPHDFAAFAALTAAYLVTNLVLVNGIVALHSGAPVMSELRDVLRTDPTSRAAEAALGLLFVLCILRQPWALLVCLPLVLAVFRAYERLATLRRETAHALETFANVVDERDPSTHEHSARVAGHVEELARGLGLPSAAVSRLRWAGRLHDLGKIAVDAAVLNKRGALAPEELASLRRHPRLSARLLGNFRLAASEARAVEYHHERFDGEGYYRVGAEHVPLAAHMLVIADSFDAMTSDRSYRRGLPVETALEEIEQQAGRQFHPALARAFVALKRGQEPRSVLAAGELRRLKDLGRPERRRRLALHEPFTGGLGPAPFAAACALAASLVALGAGQPLLAAAGLGAALVAAGWIGVERRRVARLAADLSALTATAANPAAAASALAGATAARGADWIAVVRWRQDDLAATVESSWSLRRGVEPSPEALTGWLVRDAGNRGAITADGYEVGRAGWLIALPLSDAPALATRLLVVVFAGKRRRWLAAALEAALPDLAVALEPPPDEVRVARLAAVG